MVKLTDVQTEFLNEYECMRISQDKRCDDIMIDFKCNRNKNLVALLQSNESMEEDQNCTTAHYLIIHNDNPVLYFALKAGSLFSPLERDLQELGNQILQDWRKIYPDSHEDNVQKIVDEVTNQEIVLLRNDKLTKNCVKYCSLCEDMKLEENTQTIQVAHTYSGIELVAFCADDNAKKEWNKIIPYQPLGKTMFWSKIVPILLQTQNLIGCQYCFLFAADSTEDGTLVNYYSEDLKFKRMVDIGVPKPRYDFLCVPMLCNISDLAKYQEDFFCNFGIDNDAVMV